LAVTEYDYDVLAIRARLGRKDWSPPLPGPGPAGVRFQRNDKARSVIVSSAPWDGRVWLHASIASHPNGAPLPDYWELKRLRYAVWGKDGWAFQVFPPDADLVNIRTNALHLWGLRDGALAHPNFGEAGTI
jgi:hypothetical protein